MDPRLGSQLLWDLSHRLASGVTLAQVRGLRASAVRIELFRGWVHAIDWFPLKFTLGAAPFRGEDQLRILLKRDDVDWSFDDKLQPEKRGTVAPFHPAAVIRNALAVDADAFVARAGAGRVQLLATPHPSCIGLDEKPLIPFLLQPRTLEEIERSRLVAPARAARLLAFLEAVGTLSVDGELSLASAYVTLELAEGAAPDEIKSAYRRLARALHPDAHPTASAEDKRRLEERFSAVTAAYRRLTERVA